MSMSATEKLTKMHAEFVAMLAVVRAEHPTLASAASLAAHYGVRVEDAFAEEAKQRLRRTAWAAE